MKVFAAMDGVWRGRRGRCCPTAKKRNITQTERIGAFLGGSVKVIEGRGYNADGSVGFNALGIISFNPATKAYTIRSYAGHAGISPSVPPPTGTSGRFRPAPA
jgi:hypothetical protein